MALLSNSGPPRPPTHEMVPVPELMSLARQLKEKAPSGEVSFAQVKALAESAGVELQVVYAAIAFDPNLSVDVQHTNMVAVCVGMCQHHGALDNLKEMLLAKEQADASGGPSFEVIPRTCLDMCAHSPVAISRSNYGQVPHPKLTTDGIAEITTFLTQKDT